MCEQCKLREAADRDDYEASALLTMLIRKGHADAVEDDGTVHLDISLSADEMNWLAAWGASNEDVEDADSAEEDTPAEQWEQLESDCRDRFGPGETATAVVTAGGVDAVKPYRPA